eukprot:3843557-Rhodomonas_salina.1
MPPGHRGADLMAQVKVGDEYGILLAQIKNHAGASGIVNGAAADALMPSKVFSNKGKVEPSPWASVRSWGMLMEVGLPDANV